jgi:hypothetical protein
MTFQHWGFLRNNNAAILTRTYHVLMGVHEDVEPVLFRYPQYFNRMLDPILVVLARTSCLDPLPSEHVSDRIVAVPLEPREVYVRLILGKWAVMKLDVVTVEEAIGDMGWDIWLAWKLRIGGDVDSPQEHMPSMIVAKFTVLNSQSKRRHDENMARRITATAAKLRDDSRKRQQDGGVFHLGGPNDDQETLLLE